MSCFPITFSDADFEHKFVDISTLEGIRRRYVPFGMPRLNPFFERTVFFLYGHDPQTGELNNQPIGTGVFVGVPAEGHDARLDCRHVYAVTTHHVIGAGGSIIRINTEEFQEGLGFSVASRPIEPEFHEWAFIRGGHDIAAIDVTDHLCEGDAISYIPLGLFATESFFMDVGFGIGEDGFMLGLFADIPGKNYNRIAARFGNVSLTAHKDDLIEQGNGHKHPSHVFDMRSVLGFFAHVQDVLMRRRRITMKSHVSRHFSHFHDSQNLSNNTLG